MSCRNCVKIKCSAQFRQTWISGEPKLRVQNLKLPNWHPDFHTTKSRSCDLRDAWSRWSLCRVSKIFWHQLQPACAFEPLYTPELCCKFRENTFIPSSSLQNLGDLNPNKVSSHPRTPTIPINKAPPSTWRPKHRMPGKFQRAAQWAASARSLSGWKSMTGRDTTPTPEAWLWYLFDLPIQSSILLSGAKVPPIKTKYLHYIKLDPAVGLVSIDSILNTSHYQANLIGEYRHVGGSSLKVSLGCKDLAAWIICIKPYDSSLIRKGKRWTFHQQNSWIEISGEYTTRLLSPEPTCKRANETCEGQVVQQVALPLRVICSPKVLGNCSDKRVQTWIYNSIDL